MCVLGAIEGEVQVALRCEKSSLAIFEIRELVMVRDGDGKEKMWWWGGRAVNSQCLLVKVGLLPVQVASPLAAVVNSHLEGSSLPQHPRHERRLTSRGVFVESRGYMLCGFCSNSNTLV